MDPTPADEHEPFGALIEKRLHGAESEAERAPLDRHLAECEPCRRHLEEAVASHAPMARLVSQCLLRSDWTDVDATLERRLDPRMVWFAVAAASLLVASTVLAWSCPEMFRGNGESRLAATILLAAIPFALFAIGVSRQALRLASPVTEISEPGPRPALGRRIARRAFQPVAQFGWPGRLALFGTLCLLAGLNLTLRDRPALTYREAAPVSVTFELPPIRIEVGRPAYFALDQAAIESDDPSVVQTQIHGEVRTEMVLTAGRPGFTQLHWVDRARRPWVIPVEVVERMPWPPDWTDQRRIRTADDLVREADALAQRGEDAATILIPADRRYRAAARMYQDTGSSRAWQFQVIEGRVRTIEAKIAREEQYLANRFWDCYHRRDQPGAEALLAELTRLFEVPADDPLAAFGDDPKHEEYLRLGAVLQRAFQAH